MQIVCCEPQHGLWASGNVGRYHRVRFTWCLACCKNESTLESEAQTSCSHVRVHMCININVYHVYAVRRHNVFHAATSPTICVGTLVHYAQRHYTQCQAAIYLPPSDDISYVKRRRTRCHRTTYSFSVYRSCDNIRYVARHTYVDVAMRRRRVRCSVA